MDWVSAGLAVVCLVVAALHLARLAVHARAAAAVPGGAVGELSHAVMALGMAAMFSPLGDPLPVGLWAVVFVLCGAWFAAVALRSRDRGGDAAHHVVGSAAMLFMLFSGHGHVDTGTGAAAGHPAHHGGAGGGVGLVSVVAILLAGYFAWHALRCSDRLRVAIAPLTDDGPVAPAGGGTAVRTRRPGVLRSPVALARAHVVMAVAMAVMLLAVV